MNKVLVHLDQEYKNDSTGYRKAEKEYKKIEQKRWRGQSVIDDIYDRIQKKKYKRVITWCTDFALLARAIGEYFGQEIKIMSVNADYLRGHHHYLIYDGERFMDPSIYKGYYDGDKWVNTIDKLMIDVPEELLKNIKEVNWRKMWHTPWKKLR